MKKLIGLLIILILTITLVGCGDDGNYWQAEDYYTQEEVDELIRLAIDDLEEEIREAFNDELPEFYYSKNEVDQLIQSEIDELELIIDNLEEIIFENQRRLDEDYVSEAYLWSYFYDNIGEDFIKYTEEYYMTIEDYQKLLDSDVFLYTSIIAMIDLQTNEYDETFATDEQKAIYQSYMLLRGIYQTALDEELYGLYD